MSLECSECERDLRGGHGEECSRYVKPRRVIVCGGRDFRGSNILFQVLAGIIKYNDIIVSGKAPGADTLGELYAEYYDLEVDPFPADWKNYGKAAGFRRNCDMVDSGADLVVAFWDGVEVRNDGSRSGTKHCMDYAQEQGVEVMAFNYDGIRYE